MWIFFQNLQRLLLFDENIVLMFVKRSYEIEGFGLNKEYIYNI